MNEAAEEALQRELSEELGIIVTRAILWHQHEHAYPDKTVSLSLWLVEEFNGEPKPLEHEVIQWSTLAEIAELNLLAGNWPIIERLKSLLSV